MVGLEIVSVSDGLMGRLAVHSLFICYIMRGKEPIYFLAELRESSRGWERDLRSEAEGGSETRTGNFRIYVR